MSSDVNNERTNRLRDVEAEFINPFIRAMYDTMKGMGESSAVKGTPSLCRQSSLSSDVIIAMKVEGTIYGLVVIQMDFDTAKNLISSFLMGVPISELDEMARNAILEFTLRLCEKARKLLVSKEYHSNVVHKVSFGEPITLSKEHEFIKVPYSLDYGEISVCFSIMKRKR